LKAIGEAQRSVTFENFVFSEGRIARAFVDALSARAAAGVKVHFLQDALGCNCLHGELFRKLKHAGVQVEIFRYYHITRFNHRTHRKLLVVDGRVGFVGGVGIADAWDGNADAPDRWRDTQFEVRGPVVAQIQQAFMDNWMQTRACVLHGDDYFPELPVSGKVVCQAFQSSVSENADSARLMFLFSIAAARKSIRIVNPYFIPDDLTLEMLVLARQRGVQVEIVGPGSRIDQRVVRYVGRSRWGKLFDQGTRFFEYQPALLHSKYFIVDDLWASVGSCNLDNRSLVLNEEANLNVLDADFAAELTAAFNRDQAASVEITKADWERRPISEKIIGRCAGLLRSQM
jgi:cardiolipin synthase